GRGLARNEVARGNPRDRGPRGRNRGAHSELVQPWGDRAEVDLLRQLLGGEAPLLPQALDGTRVLCGTVLDRRGAQPLCGLGHADTDPLPRPDAGTDGVLELRGGRLAEEVPGGHTDAVKAHLRDVAE